MNAKEAAKLSEQTAVKKRREAEIKAAKTARDRMLKAKEDLAKFVTELTDKSESHIKWAIEEGKRKCETQIIYGCDSPVKARACYDAHPYLDEIKREKKRLEAEGYKVEVADDTTEHSTYNPESYNDGTTYYTYGVVFKISW